MLSEAEAEVKGVVETLRFTLRVQATSFAESALSLVEGLTPLSEVATFFLTA